MTAEGETNTAKGPHTGLAIATFVLIAALHFLLLTRGTGDILGPEMLSGSFDSLAQSFLRGSAEVDPDAIRWEAFVVDGRAYMYFGPWPALLRLPLVLIAPGLAGEWARLSCFVASLLCLAAFGTLVRAMLAKNPYLEAEHRSFLLVTSLVGFGVASPLLFLMNAASIYHESIVWALAGSLCFSAIAVPRLGRVEALESKLLLLSFIAGATLLARVTYAGPLYLVLLFIGFRAMKNGTGAPRIVMLLLPAGVMLLFQLWYNAARFGSPLTFVDYSLMGFMRADPTTLEVLDRTGDFSLTRVFVALGNYFVPGSGQVSGAFPWFRLAPPAYPDAGLYPRIFTSWVMPLSLIASWLVLAGSMGLGLLLHDRTQRFAQACFFAFGLQALLVCAYYIMELRYEIDLLPLFVLGFAVFVARLGAPGVLVSRVQDVLTALLFTVALSAIVATSTTLSAIPVGGPAHPKAYKALWQDKFDAINRVLPGHD
ncbi:MAG: hypothetical protein QF570_11860 [Myxococcota bacterium]|jgi:hypothetical protein|nr:hypothetical protein [Myxococcota bacterium]